MTSAHLARFNIELARFLRAKTGRKVILYVAAAESVSAHQRYLDEGYVDDVRSYAHFHEAAVQAPADHAAIFARARRHEIEFGCVYNHLFMSRREAGRGFALGGFYHPHSPFSRTVTYPQIVHATSEMLTFWKDEIVRHEIGFFLNGTKEVAVVCRALGVTFRSLYPTRYKNYFYWAHSEFMEFPNLIQAYHAAGEKRRLPIELDVPYLHEVKTRAKLFGTNGLLKLLSNLLAAFKRQIYLWVKGYLSFRNYELTENLLHHWRVYRDGKKLRSPYTKPLSSLEGRQFVFFPLQTEPEFSLQVMSPEYLFQLGAITSLARDLPAGVMLAVKETIWGMGRRPRDFYDQIKEFRNIVLLDVAERGVDVVKVCSAVATISGSAGIEAALTGKPVILFGRHNKYEFLPHVRLVTREEELQPALARIFNGDIDLAEASQAGAQFAEALVGISFDMGRTSAFEPDTVHAKEIEDAATSLLADKSAGMPIVGLVN
jgi:hypothetical protein